MTEQPRQQSGSETPAEGLEISPEAAKAREAVIEKLEEKRDEMISNLEDAFNERMSFGGSQMEERAKDRILLLRDRQIDEVKMTYDALIKEFNERVQMDSSVNLEQLAQELLENANNKTKQRLQKLKAILNEKIEGTYMTTREAAEITRAVEGIKDFEKAHPELHQLFIKISENGALTENDYEQIVALIDPDKLPQIGDKTVESYEVTGAGLLISMMSPQQRYELVLNFMESDKKKESDQLIDGFLRTGVLTLLQGEQLLKQALEKGLLTEEKFEKKYKRKLETTYYVDRVKQFNDALQGEVYRKYSGRYSKNIVERFVGKPLLHSLLALWGGTTAIINALASREPGNFAQTLKNIASNKFFWLGAGAAGVGIEGASGSMREGRKRGGILEFLGLGEGYISQLIDNLLDDDEKADVQKRNALKTLAENYLGAPNDLRGYLEQGGHQTILKLRGQFDAQGNPVLSLDKLIEKEDHAGRKELLKNLQVMNKEPERKIDKILFAIAVSSEALGIEENERKLAVWLEKIKQTQLSNS